MKITIIAIGNKLPSWVNAEVDAYIKRFQPFNDYQLALKEIPAQKRNKKNQTQKITEIESQLLIDAIPNNALPIALDVDGKRFSSEKLAKHIENHHNKGEHLAILLGGPEGFNQSVRYFVRERWSLSDLTFPHTIARLLVAETLYRSVSIIHNHPYHRQGQIN